MHLMILACDLDGTLAEEGRVATETWSLLQRLKTANWSLILVTGRALQSFAPEGLFAEIFDAIVAEDGAVVYFPRRDIVTLPFGGLHETLLARLLALDIPLERGLAMVATRVPHDLAVLRALHDAAGGATVEYNRGAVMVIPPGATKGTGLQYALRELGCSPHNVIACGDAENDRSLFACAELRVAVRNATDDLRAQADVVLEAANGAGIRALGEQLLRGILPARRARPERMLRLGQRLDATPVLLDPFQLLDGSLAIVGSSGSGKSWLAGLLAEELLKQAYQICVIDPEGDHRAMRAFPHTLLLGGAGAPLPPVADITTLLEYAQTSLVLDLSMTTPESRTKYLAALLQELRRLRSRHGRPHWLLIDEAQSFCSLDTGEVPELLLPMVRDGGVGLVSYRPGLVAPAILGAIHHWLVTRMGFDEEQRHIDALLGASPGWGAWRDRLAILPGGQAIFVADAHAGAATATELVVFRTGPRTVPHIRHLHKYLRAALPFEKRFFFHHERGGPTGQAAANLWDLRVALAALPLDSLHYHMGRGDLERWVSQVLHDPELGLQIARLARRALRGEPLRQALVAIVGARYDELDSLV